jgi:hypothetical protein
MDQESRWLRRENTLAEATELFGVGLGQKRSLKNPIL